MRSTIGIELATTMLEDKALGNPSKIWHGCLPLHIVSNICNICSPKGMFNNFIGGESVGEDKPSLEASLEKQTLTSKGLKEKKNQYLKFNKGFNDGIVTNQN
jgi:hypothetical protein